MRLGTGADSTPEGRKPVRTPGWTFMAIDRCYCHRIPFGDIRELAEKRGADFDELCKLTHCGTSCGLCIPYIRVVLKTGRTSLPVMSAEEFSKLMKST